MQYNLLILEIKKLRFKMDLICSSSYSSLEAKLEWNSGLLILKMNCVWLGKKKVYFHQEETEHCF